MLLGLRAVKLQRIIFFVIQTLVTNKQARDSDMIRLQTNTCGSVSPPLTFSFSRSVYAAFFVRHIVTRALVSLSLVRDAHPLLTSRKMEQMFIKKATVKLEL